MNTIGANLKKERLRLALTQEKFAEIGGIKKRAQISYEQGERYPDGGYLAAIAAIGVDISFVITGQLSDQKLTQDESQLMSGYRNLSPKAKAGLLALIGGIQPQTSAASAKYASTIGQVVEGDQTINGTLHFGNSYDKKNEAT